MTTSRIALYLDVENLVHDLRKTGDYEAASDLIAGLVEALERRGVVVAKVACCDTSLARRIAFGLARAGIRTHTHRDSTPDRADTDLLEKITRELPASVDTVVVASGDHIFADVVSELRRRGKTVIVAARQGTLSWQLARNADEVLTLNEPHGTASMKAA